VEIQKRTKQFTEVRKLGTKKKFFQRTLDRWGERKNVAAALKKRKEKGCRIEDELRVHHKAEVE